MLDVQGLRAGYGRIPILNGATLSVGAGEVVGILGHNGMGKTTLLKALMGYLPATAGQVMLDGQDITRLSPTARARLGLGYVPQGRQIFGTLTVRENLRMGCLRSKRPEAETIESMLETFPRLRPLLDRIGGALSGGEQQILALARCLCGDPRLVLLDEPTEESSRRSTRRSSRSCSRCAGRGILRSCSWNRSSISSRPSPTAS